MFSLLKGERKYDLKELQDLVSMYWLYVLVMYVLDQVLRDLDYGLRKGEIKLNKDEFNNWELFFQDIEFNNLLMILGYRVNMLLE